MDELEYLRVLTQKYKHYFKEYFGFTLKEMADKLGIHKSFFSGIVNGKRPMPKKYQEQFKALFIKMRIKEKTKDFKESSLQKWTRDFRASMRKDLTRCVLFFIMFSMMIIHSSFLNPSKVNFHEYIRCRRINSRQDSLKLTAKPIVDCIKQLAIGIFLSIYTAINDTFRSIFLSLSFSYR